MHNNKLLLAANPTPNHDFGFGSVRLHDAFVFWKQIEVTAKGAFDWSRLDALVAAHAGREIMYTLGQTPDWANGQTTSFYDFGPVPPTNPQDYYDFVTALATRNRDVYGGAIKAWEIWNEPDNVKLWTGTTQQLIDISTVAAGIIKGIDPNAVIVGPGFLANGWAWFHEFARLGGLSYCDKVGYHAYPSPSQPERTEVYLRRVRASLDVLGINKPLWNTEFGYIGYTYGGQTFDNFDFRNNEMAANTMPGPLAASYITRALISAINAGAERSFWYAMDAPIMIIQLVDRVDETIVLPAATAYKHFADLISGGALGRTEAAGNTYSVAFVSGNGRGRGRIMWCVDERTASVDLSAYKSGEDALGNAITLSVNYTLTDMPIFVFN